MDKHDDVNNPKHYDLFPDQQVIDVIQSSLTADEFAGYCKGNALKYRLRAGEKGDALKCIAKANWYQKKLREVSEDRSGGWTTDYAIKMAAFRKSCDSAEAEWPDETRIDVIGQNGNDGAVYAERTLQEVIGDAELSDWARWVAVDEDGDVYEYSERPGLCSGADVWSVLHGDLNCIRKINPPADFTKCIWEIKK